MNKNIKLWVPLGHFYSPIPDLEEIRNNEDKIFLLEKNELHDINLNEKDQIKLFNKFREYYKELPFSDNKKGELLYYYKNPTFSYADAISLHCIIRMLKPKRIIEIGCGFSSCVTLDTNKIFFNNQIECKFIEPFPELLNKLTSKNYKLNIINRKLQDVDVKEFSCLSENDILFIDSTHVSKINSDVNYIFFKLLPILKKGVYIHFHDIFYPFEYPRDWIYEGRAWNEIYMLRNFLQYNNNFKIMFFNSYITNIHREKFVQYMPLYLKNTGGSIWIKKIKN